MKQKSLILFLCIGLLFLAVVQAEAKKLTVIFDQGHGQKFVIEKEGELHMMTFISIIASR